MDFLLIVFIALLIVFGLYMADAVLQMKGDIQVIRKKVNVLTASPNPPPDEQTNKQTTKKKL